MLTFFFSLSLFSISRDDVDNTPSGGRARDAEDEDEDEDSFSWMRDLALGDWSDS